MVRGIKWNDLVAGYRSEVVSVSAFVDDAGMLTVNIDGEKVLYCTPSQSELLFTILSRLYGKKLSKALINVRPDASEKSS